MNEELEPILREEWELETKMKRLGLRGIGGPKPTQRFQVKTGKLVRCKGSGIDWYKYQTQVLIPKLLPFAKECQKDRLNTAVQEDKAPSHAHYVQQRVFNSFEVERLLWCGNSPDINTIKPSWPQLKRITTKKGAPKSRKEAEKAWEKAWKELPQEKIQAWIERIPVHIQKIIDLKGGNEYKEGRDHIKRDKRGGAIGGGGKLD